ncbi:MAG: hypothetical protein HY720_09260, partial [Planctomycetes bacterium]|nr:hypothetical protein [Planctomycetota bacterium]
WYVYFYNYSNGAYWYRYRGFIREPEIVCRNLIDMEVSTAVSNPYNVTSNPLGVANADTVRVTLVLDENVTIDGEPRHVEHYLDFDVTPRLP